MSSSDTTGGSPTAAQTETAAPAAQDPYEKWLDRVQRAQARHAAIAKNLHTWSNYKSWAEQVKDSWDKDQQEHPKRSKE